MKKNKDDNTKEEYIFEINERQEKIIRKLKNETNKEINIFFENEEETDVMTDVLKKLTKVYIEDIIKLKY